MRPRVNAAAVAGTLVMVVLAGDAVLACPVCFRVEESATTDGALAAVWVLVGVTVTVLGACGRFVAGFMRRERAQCRR